ncbi:hypothetical protein [Acrocarpospora catenulata]|uniref:hypothetical protein n=1 Tax=Acrocarpospora catenulata TaxID=2836182 RepID=UPI001BD98048|nr:hypothetical protein [Acrocarpospora catenulata]
MIGAGDAMVGFAVGALCLLPFSLVSGPLPEAGFTATVVVLLGAVVVSGFPRRSAVT